MPGEHSTGVERLIQAASSTHTLPSLKTVAATVARARKAGRAEQPFFVELAGTPRAGKTTALTALVRTLQREGLRVETVTERAAECPILDKRHPFFNVWTSCTTLAQVLAAQDRSADFVLIDRGLIDAVCWMDWYRTTGDLSAAERRTIEQFLLLPLWARAIDLVVVMTTEPAVAMERELAAGGAGGASRIMNDAMLREFNQSVDRVRGRLQQDHRLVSMDTSQMKPAEVVQRLLRTVLTRFGRGSALDPAVAVPAQRSQVLPT
jgi:thymidylate kinase